MIKKQGTILIVDDNRNILTTVRMLLEPIFDGIITIANPNSIPAKLREEHPDVVLLDMNFSSGINSGNEGLYWLRKIKNLSPKTEVVLFTAYADIQLAVTGIKEGASDFIQKPLDLNRILITIKNATERSKIITENTNLKKKVFGQQMVGESAPIKHLREMIEKVAPTDARVLITGPNGSGKELVARSLHQQSSRSAMPYIEVNCAAIPSELIESELFGHEKGAFTSAIKQHKGKFEQADGGTLFLDEIGDMSLAAQAKVLRVLQERKLSRVGSDKDIEVDVRVIAATNKDLRAEIEKGNFREDLYHRLSVIVLHVPSLDERKDDIPLLVNYFNDKVSTESGMPKKEFSPQAIKMLQDKSWTGNIRELRNVVERLLILGGNPVSPQDIKDYVNIV